MTRDEHGARRVRRGRVPAAWAATVLALLVVLAVPGPGAATASTTSTTATQQTQTADPQVTPDPTATPAASADPGSSAAPQRGDCWSYGYRAAVSADGTVRAQSAVACSGDRTARTLAVDELATYADGHLMDLGAEPVQTDVARWCRTAFADAVGGSGRTRSLSLLRPVWVTPTPEAYAAGASWARCDAVLVGGDQRLAPLPGGVTGALTRRSVPPARFGRCSTRTPGDEGSREVPCTRPHRWRAVAVLAVAPAGERGAEAPYPGRASVASRARARCEGLARASQGSVRFTYSAQFPRAADWRAGQRTGTCWLPDS